MKSRQYQACLILHASLVANCPKDTWNLAKNGIRIIQEQGKFYVAVGGEPAPYAEATNEKWSKGTNPNEGWIEKAIEECLPTIKEIMSGDISEEEIEGLLRDGYYKSIAKQQADFIARKEQERGNI